MLAVLGILVQENFSVLPAEKAPALGQFSQLLSTENGQLVSSVLLLSIFFAECVRTNEGWVAPAYATRQLKAGYTPGNIGFDPLKYKEKLDESAYRSMQEKELNNG